MKIVFVILIGLMINDVSTSGPSRGRANGGTRQGNVGRQPFTINAADGADGLSLPGLLPQQYVNQALNIPESTLSMIGNTPATIADSFKGFTDSVIAQPIYDMLDQVKRTVQKVLENIVQTILRMLPPSVKQILLKLMTQLQALLRPKMPVMKESIGYPKKRPAAPHSSRKVQPEYEYEEEQEEPLRTTGRTRRAAPQKSKAPLTEEPENEEEEPLRTAGRTRRAAPQKSKAPLSEEPEYEEEDDDEEAHVTVHEDEDIRQ